MSNILNITNGDCAVETMRLGGIAGDFLAWRDVLHEGPVPGGLSFPALSEVRARFIADRGWADYQRVCTDFTVRDQSIARWRDYSAVRLWFEADLYDQLQLLQILDWFREQDLDADTLSLIETEHYLGSLAPEAVSRLIRYASPVSDEQLGLATKAWRAFRADTPEPWAALLGDDTQVLPYLHDTVGRFLEEYPRPDNGLSRSQYQTLRLLMHGATTPDLLFERYQETEQRRFMGDTVFWSQLMHLAACSPPLLELENKSSQTRPFDGHQRIEITPSGLDVLLGKVNFLTLCRPDRWLGGVHLTAEHVWFWEPDAGRLLRDG